jgi:predicted nuclease of predicted toxin-antitoxin system
MKLLFDEHIDRDILNGLIRKSVRAEIVLAVDMELQGKSDAELLEWAATHGYIVLSKDKSTMSNFAYTRMQEGLKMPGVILVTRELSIGETIENLMLLIECTTEDEFENRIYPIPI